MARNKNKIDTYNITNKQIIIMEHLHFLGSTQAGGPRTQNQLVWEYYASRGGQIFRVRSDKPYEPIEVKGYVTSRSKKNPTGYLAVSTNLLPEKYIHRIVAKLFVPNDDPENKRYVDHLDNNKHNNNADNLEWVTHSENMKRMHARRRAEGKPWHGRGGDRTVSKNETV